MGRTQPFPGRGNPCHGLFPGAVYGDGLQQGEPAAQRPGPALWSGGGAAGGGPGGLFDRPLAWADVPRNGTAWASLLLPLAGLVVVWMYRRGGIKNRRGGTDLIIQAARGEQPVSRLLAPVVFCATVLTHAWGALPAGEGPPADGGIPGRAGA